MQANPKAWATIAEANDADDNDDDDDAFDDDDDDEEMSKMRCRIDATLGMGVAEEMAWWPPGHK